MARVDWVEVCLPHSASVHCTLGPVRLGTQSPLCMALSQTTPLIAQLTLLPSAPCSQCQISDPLALPQTLLHPSPLACLPLWNTPCGRAWSLGVLSASTVAGLLAPHTTEAGKQGSSWRLYSFAFDEGPEMSLLKTT